MHLAFLTPEYPHPSCIAYGGLGTSIRNLAEGLTKRNIKVTIFVYGQKKDLRFSENQIDFHFIKQIKYTGFGWYFYRKFLQSYLNKIVVKKKIDVLEAPDWTGITAFMKLKCPLVIRLHGSDTYFCKLEGRKQKIKNFWFEKLALQKADYILSVSAFAKNKTKEYFNLDRKIQVIPNSVDVNSFKPDHHIEISPNTILYFGSIIRKKGVLELADIFNKIIERKPDVILKIAGRDVFDIFTEESTLELFKNKLSNNSKGRIQWLGSLPYPEIKKEIAKAAVVVFPSYAEALPMAWLEAMAMEKPLVTTNIGWAREVVKEGDTGYMLHPTEHKEYADKIISLLDDNELAHKFAKAARARIVREFSNEVVIKRNLDFYNEIILEN